MAVNVLHVNDKQCCIIINGNLTIDTCDELTDSLRSPLFQYHEVDIDLISVNEMDIHGLQLLTRIKIIAKARGKLLRIVSHSQAVQAFMGEYDMEDYFRHAVDSRLQQ